MSPFVMHLWAAAAALDVRDTEGGGNSTLQTDQVVTLPTFEADDVVLIMIRLGTAATVTTPSGWTAVVTNNEVTWSGLYRRTMTGSEGSTVTFVASASSRAAWVAVSVEGAAIAEASFVEAAIAVASEDPPNVTASWGADDNLALAFLVGKTNDWEATAPSGYGGLFLGQTEYSTADTRVRVYGAYRAITTASEDPGAWTITVGATDTPRAFTVLVRPA